MTSILSFIVVAILASWFIVTVLSHLERTRPFVRSITTYDICGVVPIWTFFAPNPGRTDVYLLYRDRDAEGNITQWRDIVLERRSEWWSFWNPQRRIGKAVVDLAPDLTAGTPYEARTATSKRKVLEFQYLLILNYVCKQPADFRAEMRQFAVARTEGHGTEHQPEVVFLSAFHRLR